MTPAELNELSVRVNKAHELTELIENLDNGIHAFDAHAEIYINIWNTPGCPAMEVRNKERDAVWRANNFELFGEIKVAIRSVIENRHREAKSELESL